MTYAFALSYHDTTGRIRFAWETASTPDEAKACVARRLVGATHIEVAYQQAAPALDASMTALRAFLDAQPSV